MNISKRDYFAGLAMQSILQTEHLYLQIKDQWATCERTLDVTVEDLLSRKAFEYADSMIALSYTKI